MGAADCGHMLQHQVAVCLLVLAACCLYIGTGCAIVSKLNAWFGDEMHNYCTAALTIDLCVAFSSIVTATI